MSADNEEPYLFGACQPFRWIHPGDPDWDKWRAWNWYILVMTSEVPLTVRVPESGTFPFYCNPDGSEEAADPDEWLAWSPIPWI